METTYLEPIEKTLRDGAADGSLRAPDPHDLAMSLFTMVGLGYLHLRTDHGWEVERALRASLGPVLHGVLPTGDSAEH